VIRKPTMPRSSRFPENDEPHARPKLTASVHLVKAL